MCINPSWVHIQRGAKWEQTPVACRQCWRCKRNRVNDYVARAMAESSTSVATCAITLTYAPRNDLADKLLTPRHFQLFMKQLRRAGHLVRYLVVGEYGDLKGRAHFHALLFFSHLEQKTEVPFYNPSFRFASSPSAPFSGLIPNKDMVHIREWPHGHVKCDWSADERSARYVCKYLLSENKNNCWFSLSKKPALGSAFFASKAEQATRLGVLPSSFNYLPPNGNKDRAYMMKGATRRDYLAAITTDPAQRRRMSEWVQKAFDKDQRVRWQKALEAQTQEQIDAAYVGLYERLTDLEAQKQKRDNDALNAYIEQAIEANLGPVYKKDLFNNGTQQNQGCKEW